MVEGEKCQSAGILRILERILSTKARQTLFITGAPEKFIVVVNGPYIIKVRAIRMR